MRAVVDFHTILNAEPCIATGEVRIWGDVGENGKDQLIRELEDCGRDERG